MTVTELLILTLGLLTAGSLALLVLAYVRRQKGPNRCPGCGYDLSGVERERCSECGRRIGNIDLHASWVATRRRLVASGALLLFVVVLDVTAGLFWSSVWPERVPTKVLILFDEVLFPEEGKPPSAVRQEFAARQGAGWSEEVELAVLKRHLRRMCERGMFVAIRDKWPADRPPRILPAPMDDRILDWAELGPFECTERYILKLSSDLTGTLAERATNLPYLTAMVHNIRRMDWSDRVREIPWAAVGEDGEIVIDIRVFERDPSEPRSSRANYPTGRLLTEERVRLPIRQVASIEEAIRPLDDASITNALRTGLQAAHLRLERDELTVVTANNVVMATWPTKTAIALRLSIEAGDVEIASTRFRFDAGSRFSRVQRSSITGQDEVFLVAHLPLEGDLTQLQELREQGTELTLRVTGDADLALNDPYATHYWDGEFVVPLDSR
jgi:hypothetical protein